MPDRDDIKEQIKTLCDPVDVIGEFVDLRQRGRNWTGLCPFHEEKTPSFTVFPDRNLYKCFGCGKAGDVFSFLMEYHGMSFPEAMKTLARRCGVNLPEQQQKSDRSQEKFNKKEAAFKALEAAAGFFHDRLFTKEGKIAKDYFEGRGFSPELIKKFSLGYATNDWRSLMNFLTKKGWSEEVLETAGLIVKKEDGKTFDRFRGRPIFTIRDAIGRVVGFGARKIRDDDPIKGKYINSPQSDVYDKSKLLYGLFEGKNAVRNSGDAILVEGYADVLTLHQAGIENAVASSGTSVTKEQLASLSRLCRRLYFVYDADEAGINAAERGIELALQHNFEIMVVVLPQDEDPDDIVRRGGKEGFEEWLGKAKSFLDFKYDRIKTAGRLETLDGRVDSAREFIRLINNVPDEIKKDAYLQHIFALLKLNESQFRKLLQERNRETKARQSRPAKSEYDEIQETVVKILKTLRAEEYLLFYIILSSKGALDMFFEKFDVGEDIFVTNEAKRLFSILVALSEESSELLDIIINNEEINNIARQVFTEIAFVKERPSDKWKDFGVGVPETDIERNIRDALHRLEIIKIDEKIRPEMDDKLKTENDIEKQIEIVDEIRKISERRQELHAELDYYRQRKGWFE